MELSYENFLQYYRSQEFEEGLQNYFKVTESKDGYRIILFMENIVYFMVIQKIMNIIN